MNRSRSADRWESESPRVLGVGWARLILAATIVVVLVGGFFTIRAVIYAHNHVRATRASVEGMIVSVGPRAGGRLTRVLVKPGQEVQAGQQSAWLDKESLEQGVREAQAKLAGARAQANVAEADLQRQSRLVKGSLLAGAADLHAAETRYEQAGVQANAEESSSRYDVEQAYTALTQAEKRLARLQAGARPQEVEVAKAALRAAEARLGAAQNDLKRKEKLLADGYVSAGQVENARAQAEIAQAERDQAAQSLELLRAGSRKEDLELAQMEVAQAKAAHAAAKARATRVVIAKQHQTERAHEVVRAQAGMTEASAGREQLEMAQRQVRAAAAQVAIAEAGLDAALAARRGAYVRSPVAGVVAEVLLNPGEIVAPGQPVALVVSRERYWIVASVPETRVRKVAVNQPVEVELQAYEKTKLTGKVVVVGGATVTRAKAGGAGSDGAAGGQGFAGVPEVPVTVEFDYGRMKLTPGMSARVVIDVSGSG